MKTGKDRSTSQDKVRSGENSPGFNMPLPMRVSGIDTQGKEFQESSVLAHISSEEASFFLKTKVDRQSLLKLVIPLPPKLADGQQLKLVLKGKVVSVESVSGNEDNKRILLKLDSRYFIGADET
jgi:hypothetical protein